MGNGGGETYEMFLKKDLCDFNYLTHGYTLGEGSKGITLQFKASGKETPVHEFTLESPMMALLTLKRVQEEYLNPTKDGVPRVLLTKGMDTLLQELARGEMVDRGMIEPVALKRKRSGSVAPGAKKSQPGQAAIPIIPSAPPMPPQEVEEQKNNSQQEGKPDCPSTQTGGRNLMGNTTEFFPIFSLLMLCFILFYGIKRCLRRAPKPLLPKWESFDHG